MTSSPTHKLQCLQANINHSKTEQLQLEAYLASSSIHIAMITEPYTKKGKFQGISNYSVFGTGRTCIYVKKTLSCRTTYQNGDTIVVEVGKVQFASCYWSPNENIEVGLVELEEAMETGKDEPWIVTGDLNVGLSPVVNQSRLRFRKKARSEIAQNFIEASELIIANDKTPTCYHMGYESINDYTLYKKASVEDWKTLDINEINNGHQYISFSVRAENLIEEEFPRYTTDLEKFEVMIQNPPKLMDYTSLENTKENATRITEWLKRTIEECTTKKKENIKIAGGLHHLMNSRRN